MSSVDELDEKSHPRCPVCKHWCHNWRGPVHDALGRPPASKCGACSEILRDRAGPLVGGRWSGIADLGDTDSRKPPPPPPVPPNNPIDISRGAAWRERRASRARSKGESA